MKNGNFGLRFRNQFQAKTSRIKKKSEVERLRPDC